MQAIPSAQGQGFNHLFENSHFSHSYFTSSVHALKRKHKCYIFKYVVFVRSDLYSLANILGEAVEFYMVQIV